MSDRHAKSRAAAQELADLVPGGAHTYAKGPDQYPADVAPIIARGQGSHVWDVDGNEYVEYGSGLRSVSLGHAHPTVLEAVIAQLADGSNYARPSLLELTAAQEFLGAVPTMDMVKFAKNGSDATTAAVRLARAVTGRDRVAICRDQPFFSVDDWFIGSTPMPAGIPASVQSLTVGFPFGDLAALDLVLTSGEIAAVVLEADSAIPAPVGYLPAVIELAHRHGALVIVDEMLTGFRYALGGAHSLLDARPDLVAFGKAIANGFSVSALAGRREIMERGGLNTDDERVFLLSTTHGAEGAGLAAMRATIDVHRREDISRRLDEIGGALRAHVNEVVQEAGLGEHIVLRGRNCNLVYATLDELGEPSQAFRTLFIRELLMAGVLAPSFVVSAAVSDADIEHTANAVRSATVAYQRALDSGDPSPWTGGRSVKPVFRPRA